MSEQDFKKMRNIIITIYIVAVIFAITTFIVTKTVRSETETPETENIEAVKIKTPKFEYLESVLAKNAIERLEFERINVECLEAEQLEQKRLEAERLEAERLERERLEAERIEAERLEAERLEKERLEKERITTIIAKVIYAEARGEPFKGKIAVGASIINRMQSERFPNTVEDVIKGTYAKFDWVTDEMLARVPECREAAERAVAGEDPLRDILGGPTFYFYNPDLCGKEALNNRKGIETYRIGNHLFYTSTPDGRW